MVYDFQFGMSLNIFLCFTALKAEYNLIVLKPPVSQPTNSCLF